VVKNKVAPPFREAQFDILYNEGISKLGDLIDVAVEQNIIAKSGSWFSYKEERIGQGRDMVKKFLLDNEKLLVAVERETRTKLGLPAPNAGNGATPAADAKPPKADAAEPKAPAKPEPPKKK
jgi:recombination protein RecA